MYCVCDYVSWKKLKCKSAGGSNFKECCKNKKNVSATVLEWLFRKENITRWKLNTCITAENGNTDYADDIILLSASCHGIQKLVDVCIEYGI